MLSCISQLAAPLQGAKSEANNLGDVSRQVCRCQGPAQMTGRIGALPLLFGAVKNLLALLGGGKLVGIHATRTDDGLADEHGVVGPKANRHVSMGGADLGNRQELESVPTQDQSLVLDLVKISLRLTDQA